MENITAKQVAQTFYLDEIVAHEIILEAYSNLEKELKQYPVRWEKSDIVYKLCNTAMEHNLCNIFKLQKTNILNLINTHYTAEITQLYLIGNSANDDQKK